MCAASSPTHPSSADPRVCIHDKPRKYRPGDAVTPRVWTTAAVGVEDGHVHPRVVEGEAGGPDDARDLDVGALGERDGGPARAGRPAMQDDAAAPRTPRAGADEGVAGLYPPPEARVRRLAQRAHRIEPAEDVAAEQALWQRLLARAQRQVNLVRRAELLGDLVAGIAAADDEHAAVGDLRRVAVGRALDLDDTWIELRCERGGAGRLERARGDDDLVGAVRPAVEPDDVALALAAQLADAAAQLHRKVAGVVGEIGDHLVARRVAVGLARERLAGEAVVARRREEPQRVPALPPRRGGCVGCLENGEAAAVSREVVADRKTGLAAADDDDLVVARAAHGDLAGTGDDVRIATPGRLP